MIKNFLVLIILSLLTIGCGKISRIEATLTGYSKEYVSGVLYYQFTSGAVVAYNPDGTIKRCE